LVILPSTCPGFPRFLFPWSTFLDHVSSFGKIFILISVYPLIHSIGTLFSSCYYLIDFDGPLNPEYKSLATEKLLLINLPGGKIFAFPPLVKQKKRRKGESLPH
jgi:hypothetical protein